MTIRPAAVATAFFTLAACYFFGVVFFYAPIAAADVTGGPLVPQGIAFVVSITLYVALLVWVTEQMNHALKAALTIAVAQFLLVNVDNLLTGKRGLSTAVASTVLLFVSWTLVGFVYQRMRRASTHDSEHGGRHRSPPHGVENGTT